jgi:phosphatidylglycerophosphate synthase
MNKKTGMSFREFKEKAMHKTSTPVPILFIESISIRLAYLIYKFKLKISPTDITMSRLLFFFPIVIFLCFSSVFHSSNIVFLLIPLFCYLGLFTDWLDGQLARGTGKTSESGAFLDSISDRIGMLLFFLIIFSIGVSSNNIFLIGGSILLFVIKSLHMTVITMMFYYDNGKTNDSKNKFFSDESANKKLGISRIFILIKNISDKLGLRRWNGSIGVVEQYFVTLIVIPLLFYFGLKVMTTYILYFMILIYFLFYLIRIFSIVKDFVKTLS